MADHSSPLPSHIYCPRNEQNPWVAITSSGTRFNREKCLRCRSKPTEQEGGSLSGFGGRMCLLPYRNDLHGCRLDTQTSRVRRISSRNLLQDFYIVHISDLSSHRRIISQENGLKCIPIKYLKKENIVRRST